MITEKDLLIGNSVRYTPAYKGSKPEDGIITSWNDSYVFVKFNINNACGQACRREDLSK